ASAAAARQRLSPEHRRQEDAFDERILAELRASAPQAVPIFDQANEARDRDDHRTAADLYAKVFEQVPAFVHALRRRSYQELLDGHRDLAIQLARQAAALDPSAANLSTLADILMTGSTVAPSTGAELDEALQLARRASSLEPDDVDVNMTLCLAVAGRNEQATFQRCLGRLMRSASEEPT